MAQKCVMNFCGGFAAAWTVFVPGYALVIASGKTIEQRPEPVAGIAGSDLFAI